MPDVDRPADVAEVFAKARQAVADPVQRRVAIVTPGRMIMFVPAPDKAPEGEGSLAGIKDLLKSTSPLAITAISYTKLEALMADETHTKCIPFLGHLLAMAFLGHHVIVFEGHHSAFEAGVAGADVVLVDSGMAPFLQDDWAPAVFRLMKAGGRLLVHDRARYALAELRPRAGKGASGAPDGGGEMAYINGLLTALAQTRKSIVIAEGAPLPDDRANLSVERVIELLLRAAKPEGLLRRRLVLRATLIDAAGSTRVVAFKLTAGLRDEGKQTLTIDPL
jgi:hypothetical protein